MSIRKMINAGIMMFAMMALLNIAGTTFAAEGNGATKTENCSKCGLKKGSPKCCKPGSMKKETSGAFCNKPVAAGACAKCGEKLHSKTCCTPETMAKVKAEKEQIAACHKKMTEKAADPTACKKCFQKKGSKECCSAETMKKVNACKMKMKNCKI